MPDFKIKGTIWDGKNLYELYKEAHTPWEWHEILFKTAEEEGLICFSSPFDKTVELEAIACLTAEDLKKTAIYFPIIII